MRISTTTFTLLVALGDAEANAIWDQMVYGWVYDGALTCRHGRLFVEEN